MSADVRTDVRRLPRTSLRTTADLHMEILRTSAQKKFPACVDLRTKRPNTPQTSAGKCPQFSMRNITFFADISGTGSADHWATTLCSIEVSTLTGNSLLPMEQPCVIRWLQPGQEHRPSKDNQLGGFIYHSSDCVPVKFN